MERRLSAILAADVVGYSRLMGEDEAGTLAALKACRKELIDPKAQQYHGRIIKLMGDGALMEFASVVDAVAFAVEVQVAMRARNTDVPAEKRIEYRIGINVGDVIVEDEDIYGDGVNIASRLEGLAEPGGICVRRNVRNQVRDRFDLDFEDLGEIEVKNIARPVRVFQIVLDQKASALVTPIVTGDLRPRKRRWPVISAGTLVVLIIVGAVWWQPWSPTLEPTALDGTSVPLPDKPSLVVLPFENLSGDTEQDYFADGLTDDLITDLSKLSGLLVIARNSSFAFKERSSDLAAIARDLGVRYVLDGSVRRAGSSVRINARLLDGLKSDLVWAERYDREYDNIFAIQDEVIAGIVQALSVKLTDEEQTDLSQLPTKNLEAYDYYLRAERLAYIAEAGSTGDALNLYQRAISLDRDFADAYAGYARVAVDVLSYGFVDNLPSAVARKRAYEAASRAAQLNPRLGRSYSVLALLQMLDGEHRDAIDSARKAVEASPNDSEAHLNLAVVLIYAGLHEEALQEFEIVLRLNPKAPAYVHEYRALAHYLLGHDEEALAELARAPTEVAGDLRLELLAEANARLGRPEAAREALSEIIRRVPDACVAWFRVLFAHHARAEDLTARAEALRLAGLPQWPLGFEGDPASRLSADEIDALIAGGRWAGERVGIGPFIRYLDASGVFAERGPSYQLSGTFSRQGDLLCMRSEAILLGRQVCGPIYRSLNLSDGQGAVYSYPNAFALYHFSTAN